MTLESSSTPGEPDTGHPDRWRVLVVCCGGLFLLVSSLTSLNVALPDLQADLGASTADLQWVIDSYAVVFGGLLLTGGAIGDRTGRRPSLAIGFAIIATGSLIGALAESIPTVIVARVVMGLGAALLMPATLSTLTEVFSDHERPRAIAVWSGIAGAGAAFGPAIGGWLIEIGSWNAVFSTTVVLATLGFLATLRVVPALPIVSSTPLDPLGSILSTAAIGFVLFAIIEAPSHPTSPVVFGTAFAGLAAAAAFIAHEHRTPTPMVPLSVFDNPTRRTGLITLLFAAVGFAGVIFVGALLLQIGWGEGPLVTGLLLMPVGVTELAISLRTAELSERFGSGRVVAVGLSTMAIGYSAMALTPVGDRLLFVVAAAIAGIGTGLTIPPSVERVMADADPELAGVVAGTNETAIELGASLGIAVLGGLQRIAFGAALPAGASSESLDAALVSTDVDTAVDAYITGGRGALFGAAIAMVIVIPVAIRERSGVARDIAEPR